MVSTNHITFEESKPLSSSLIWKLQEDYFSKHGVTAWSSNYVPFYVTSNLVISKSYADVIFRYIQDGVRLGFISGAQPLYIFETGAGSGKLGFYIVAELLKRANQFDYLLDCFRYVLTDFTQSNIDFWKTQPQLMDFVQKGVLDFALYDLNKSDSLSLFYSSTVFSSDAPTKSSIAVIANYVFDTIPHDLFKKTSDGIFHGLTTLETSQSNITGQNSVHTLDDCRVSFDYEPCEYDYYENQALNRALLTVASQLDNSSFLVPVGAISCIDFLRSLTSNNLLMLVGDKGHSSLDSLEGLGDPYVSFHGSFSLMVNFPLLNAYINVLEGSSIGARSEQGLKIALYTFGTSIYDLPETSLAFENSIANLNTHEYLKLKNFVLNNIELADLQDLLSVMRLSLWDPIIASSFCSRFIELADKMTFSFRQELNNGLLETVNNYFIFSTHNNYIFDVGRLFQVVGNFNDAIRCYELAKKVLEEWSGYYNIALCYFELNNQSMALANMEKALELDPGNTDVISWIDQLNSSV